MTMAHNNNKDRFDMRKLKDSLANTSISLDCTNPYTGIDYNPRKSRASRDSSVPSPSQDDAILKNRKYPRRVSDVDIDLGAANAAMYERRRYSLDMPSPKHNQLPPGCGSLQSVLSKSEEVLSVNKRYSSPSSHKSSSPQSPIIKDHRLEASSSSVVKSSSPTQNLELAPQCLFPISPLVASKYPLFKNGTPRRVKSLPKRSINKSFDNGPSIALLELIHMAPNQSSNSSLALNTDTADKSLASSLSSSVSSDQAAGGSPEDSLVVGLIKSHLKRSMDSSSSSPPTKKVTTDCLQNHMPDEPPPVALLFVEYDEQKIASLTKLNTLVNSRRIAKIKNADAELSSESNDAESNKEESKESEASSLLPIESKPPSKLRWNEDLVAVRDIVHAVLDEEETEEKQTSVEENPEKIVKPILRLKLPKVAFPFRIEVPDIFVQRSRFRSRNRFQTSMQTLVA